MGAVYKAETYSPIRPHTAKFCLRNLIKGFEKSSTQMRNLFKEFRKHFSSSQTFFHFLIYFTKVGRVAIDTYIKISNTCIKISNTDRCYHVMVKEQPS